MDRLSLAQEIARRWNDAGVRYAVAHGIEQYPERMGRDLDVVVRRQDVRRAIAMARAVLEERGLAIATPPPLWGERLIAAERRAATDLFELHTTTRITWRNAAIVDDVAPSDRVGPFAIDPWVSVAKRIMLPLLAGARGVLDAGSPRLRLDDDERAAAAPRLARLVGASLAPTLLDAVARADAAAIAALAPAARRAVLRRSAMMHPLRSSMLLGEGFLRRLRLPLAPCAPVVAVVGAPAADARALAHEIAAGDRLVFTDVVVRRANGGSALARALRDRIDSSRQRLVLYEGTPARTTPDLTLVVGSDPAPDGGDARVLLPAGLDAAERRVRAMAHIIDAFIARNQPVTRP